MPEQAPYPQGYEMLCYLASPLPPIHTPRVGCSRPIRACNRVGKPLIRRLTPGGLRRFVQENFDKRDKKSADNLQTLFPLKVVK
jgi:hypothetical protein